jgi:hypothetical protein
MTDYDNNLRGALFKNERKRPDKKDPDYTGTCQIAGVEFFIDSWINEAKTGAKYMALKFKMKGHRAVVGEAPPPAAEPEPLNDEIPF